MLLQCAGVLKLKEISFQMIDDQGRKSYLTDAILIIERTNQLNKQASKQTNKQKNERTNKQTNSHTLVFRFV